PTLFRSVAAATACGSTAPWVTKAASRAVVAGPAREAGSAEAGLGDAGWGAAGWGDAGWGAADMVSSGESSSDEPPMRALPPQPRPATLGVTGVRSARFATRPRHPILGAHSIGRSDMTDTAPAFARHQELAGLLAEEIRSGRYPVGSRFPTESELKEKLGIGRHSIREALKLLAEQGMLGRR